jgi:hypothetical protein
MDIKGRVVSVHSVRAYRGRRNTVAFILNLGARWT